MQEIQLQSKKGVEIVVAVEVGEARRAGSGRELRSDHTRSGEPLTGFSKGRHGEIFSLD